MYFYFFFFFNDTATTEIYTLSLHDALPIFDLPHPAFEILHPVPGDLAGGVPPVRDVPERGLGGRQVRDREQRLGLDERSEEHTSELQSRQYLVCRLLLEKKKETEEVEIGGD